MCRLTLRHEIRCSCDVHSRVTIGIDAYNSFAESIQYRKGTPRIATALQWLWLVRWAVGCLMSFAPSRM